MWKPTEHFLHGEIIKPFLPLEKHPNLINSNLSNLYPGDEIYIFETKNGKWARGYSLSKPFPNDFTITSVNLDQLPGINVQVVVFPLKYFQLLETIPFESDQLENDVGNHSIGDIVPTIQDLEFAHTQASLGNRDFIHESKSKIPPLPHYSLGKDDDLWTEIKHALELLTSHIYALYSIGEFRLFYKLLAIYNNLHETRTKLINNLLTSSEIDKTKETATFLLNKIPKKLASRAARLNITSFDLDNQYSDTSGYKAILARDASTSELLSNGNSIPSELALSQLLCALAPNFPINSQNVKNKVSLKPVANKKLVHESPSHIMVDLKSVSGSSAYQPPGFAGMTAYLYIRNNRKRLTEAFAVHTDSIDDLVRVEKISASLFRNIPANEIENTRVYLVAVLTEEVDLNLKTTNLPLIRRVKKGVAAGVADITRVFSRNKGSLESGEAHPFTIKLFGSYKNTKKGKSESSLDANNGWGELVDRIISGSSHGVAVNPRAETLVVSVKEFKHQFSGQTLSPVTSGPISRIKPIFFDPLAENYERIYLSLGKISLLNTENKDDLLTIEVSTPNNDMITFAKASNQQQKNIWQFVSVYPEEIIGEIIKINGISLKNAKAPKEDYIVLSLYVNGLLAGAGRLLYKSGNRLVEFSKKKIYTIEIISTAHNVPMAQLELSTEYIGKIYNSDISIDNIFQFENSFRGGQKGIEELSNSLVAFCKLDISQLLKYFPELLSSLYTIVDTSSQQSVSPSIKELQDNCFKAIVHLLDAIFGKQDQYLYLIDDFIYRYSELPPIGIFLMNKVSEVFAKSETTWNSLCRALCRVVSLVLKLALNSIDETSDTEELDSVISTLFKSGSSFLKIQNSALISDQILLIETVDCILTLGIELDQAQILNHIINFVDSIGTRGLGANEESNSSRKNGSTSAKDHKIIISKLLLINRLFNTQIIDTAASRLILVSNSVHWAMEVLLGPTDVEASRLACSVLNSVCTLLWDTVFVKRSAEEMDLCFSLSKLLPAISRTFIKYNKYARGNELFNSKRTFTQLFPTEYPFKEISMDPIVNDEIVVEILCEIATVFSFISKIAYSTADNEGFIDILNHKVTNDFFLPEKYLANDFQNEDILTLISGVKLIRQGKFFPEEKWLSFYSMLAESSLSVLELVRPMLTRYYIPPIEESEEFDRVLWGNYLLTLLKLATLAPVSTEHLTDVPKKLCFQITGSMRDRIAFLVEDAWKSLSWEATEEDLIRFSLKRFGGYQVEFINQDYSILQDLMLFVLQKNARCQAVGVKILWTILISEYILSDNIIDIERECLLGLKEIYSRNNYKPGREEQISFIERMKLTIRLDREDEAFNIIYKFIETLQGFMAVLNDLNSVPVGPEFDDDRTFHKLNIKSYLKNANRPELFHSFINSMYEENLAKNDFIQAALSLELLASSYNWDHNTVVPPSFRPKFPEQTSFERKEALSKLVATNYIKGNSLEKATDTYNELLDAYNAHTYDLKSFAYVHNKLAKLYLELESSDKLSPSFFRVAFIGGGFPTNIRGKEQIYEGLPFEHITSIHERLLRLYPGARIVSDDSEAQKLKEKVQTGRYLHVNTVEPVNEISDKLFNTSIGVRQYARNKDLRFFHTMKRIPGSTSVFDLWTEETTYETFLSFPTLMNRSDIKATQVVKLSPLDNAIRTIVNKNNELIQLESMINIAYKDKANYSTFLNDLSRQLAGTVDSPVNGGVGLYREFFTDKKYSGPEYAAQIRLLKNAFNDLTTILNRTLHLHGKLVSSSMKSSQDALIDLFKKNFRQEIKSLKLNTDHDNVVYNHNTSHVQSNTTLPNDRRSVSGLSSTGSAFASTASLGGASRLNRTDSRTSSASSTSGVSGISFSNIDATSTSTYKSKRTAVNWRTKTK